MNAEFLNAWRIYRHGARRPAFAGEAPRGDAAFDGEVKVGEIRVFADGNHPLTALIVEDCGLAGRRIVPVSPFAAPASVRELAIGARVFQLWNTTRASRRFTDRSWRVDVLSAGDLARVRSAIAAAWPGRLTAGDGPQARYEREFLISAGNFIPWAAPPSAALVERWRFHGWGVAAAMAVCLGAFYLMFGHGGGRLTAVWNEVVFRVAEEDDVEIIELIEPMPAEVAFADVVRDQIQRENAPQNAIPPLPHPRPIAAVVKTGRLPVHDGGRAPGAVPAGRVPQQGFARPQELSVLLASGPSAGSAPGSAPTAYSVPGAPSIASAGTVDCTVTECPWNMSHRLLNIRAATAQGLTIEVGFDLKSVGGYRLLSNVGTYSINAFYEIVPNGLSGLPPDAVSVTTRWYEAAGERMRMEKVRPGRASDLLDLPFIPRQPADVTGAISPDDVPVKVDF
ncbi:MAG: hypothetical protein ACI4R9_09155 [Kiritimatiellia bacterium]